MTTIQEEDFASAYESVHRRAPATFEAMLEPENVSTAWERVRRNRGCAGVDGVSIAELLPIFDQEWLSVERAIRAGVYRPQPLLRVRIPKPSGGERLLGIPTVMDRVVQQSMAQVLSPCWEPVFSPRSFAYRPGRGPRNALGLVETALNHGAPWALHLDIKDFFDSVPHAVVLGELATEVADQRLAALVRQTLQSGVYEHGIVRPMSVGLAQGSPLSPLLANVVLHPLDTKLEAAGWEFARYADDCLVLLPGEEIGTKARRLVIQILEDLGLRLNEQKTTFGHFTESRFLGFAFRQDAHGRAIREASPEALAEAEKTLLRVVQSAGYEGQSVAVEAAEMLQSWLTYFHTAESETVLRTLVDRIVAAWQARFPRSTLPTCLQWENLCRRHNAGERVGYSGHFEDGDTFDDSINWSDSFRCLLLRLWRSRWWRLEYDLGWGRPHGFRLCLGRHRINIRF